MLELYVCTLQNTSHCDVNIVYFYLMARVSYLKKYHKLQVFQQ